MIGLDLLHPCTESVTAFLIRTGWFIYCVLNLPANNLLGLVKCVGIGSLDVGRIGAVKAQLDVYLL